MRTDKRAETTHTASTTDEAHQRAIRIRNGLDSLHTLRADIAAAYNAGDWATLGYDTWDSYVTAEFVGARLRVPRDERRELVASLREAGLSTRAIAAATGQSVGGTHNDIGCSEMNTSTARESVTGRDGRTYSSTKPPVSDLISNDQLAELTGHPPAGEQPGEPIDAEIITDTDQPPGDTPVPNEPKSKRPRRPLTEQARDAGWDIRKNAERIDRLMSDDRYSRNADALATLLRPDLEHVHTIITRALTNLTDQ